MPVYPLNFCLVTHKRAAQHNHFAAFHNALAHFDHATIAAREGIKPGHLFIV